MFKGIHSIGTYMYMCTCTIIFVMVFFCKIDLSCRIVLWIDIIIMRTLFTATLEIFVKPMAQIFSHKEYYIIYRMLHNEFHLVLL